MQVARERSSAGKSFSSLAQRELNAPGAATLPRGAADVGINLALLPANCITRFELSNTGGGPGAAGVTAPDTVSPPNAAAALAAAAAWVRGPKGAGGPGAAGRAAEGYPAAGMGGITAETGTATFVLGTESVLTGAARPGETVRTGVAVPGMTPVRNGLASTRALLAPSPAAGTPQP